MTEIDWQRKGVQANGLTLHLEHAGPTTGEAIVLIMGLGGQLIQWPEALCADLISRGFRVIRFDNRDAGLSDEANRGVRFSLRGDYLRVRLGLRPGPSNYLLHDMVEDTIGLLDALSIERAHLVGASMGGMIAQLVAAAYPQRVRSLTSIMSGTNHPWTLATELKLLLRLSSPPPDHRRESIVATGGFENRLAAITAPTLILHGAQDRLQRLACGKRSAKLIRGARLHVIDGMGHDLPAALMPQWAELISENATRADR